MAIKDFEVIGMRKASVAEVKNKLSEYISRVSISGENIIITKRDKPVAAIISIGWMERLESMKEAEGLASAAGKWKAFSEIAGDVEKAFASRRKNGGRKTSL